MIVTRYLHPAIALVMLMVMGLQLEWIRHVFWDTTFPSTAFHIVERFNMWEIFEQHCHVIILTNISKLDLRREYREYMTYFWYEITFFDSGKRNIR